VQGEVGAHQRCRHAAQQRGRTREDAGGQVQVDVQRHLRNGDTGGLLALRLRLRRVRVVQDVLPVLPGFRLQTDNLAQGWDLGFRVMVKVRLRRVIVQYLLPVLPGSGIFVMGPKSG